MKQICHAHCPGGAGGLTAAAVVAVSVLVAAVVALAPALPFIAAVVAAADLAGAVAFGALMRAGGRMWRPGATVKVPVRVAVEARRAPLAIEAPKRLVISFTETREGSVER